MANTYRGDPEQASAGPLQKRLIRVYLGVSGQLAQLAERLVDVEKVTGSSPVLPNSRQNQQIYRT